MSLNFSKTIIIFISLITIIPILFSPVFSKDSINVNILNNYNISMNLKTKFHWPTPGYTRISSYFGKRNSPTKYASSFHKGIDIAAPTGAIIVASVNSKVKYTGFSGSGGYTIILESGNLQFVYHHLSPNFLVNAGMYVYSGDIIGHVGPKNVYGIKNNPYKDSFRKSNKWCYNWCSFTFYNKKRRHSRQSFKLFLITYLHLHFRNHYDVHNNYNHVHILHHYPNLIL